MRVFSSVGVAPGVLAGCLLLSFVITPLCSKLLAQPLSARFHIVEPLDSAVLQRYTLDEAVAVESNLRAQVLRCLSSPQGCAETLAAPRLVVIDGRELVTRVSLSSSSSAVATVEWVYP